MQYYIFNKPFGTLCQFSGEEKDSLLGDFFNYPKDVYSIGRLDKDSEGLLLLTNDNQLKTRTLNPNSKTDKTYFVQVEGIVSDQALEELSNGSIIISHKGKKHKVLPAKASILNNFKIEDRNPAIRKRANIPTTWISLTITEGKNRQVRKMTAAAGIPTLRLIRMKVGALSLENLKIGEVKEISKATAYSLCK